MPEKKPIVRAIDVGFGMTKETIGIDANGDYKFFSFPSIAPKAAKSATADGFGASRDTVVVEVSGINYEVGPDSTDLLTGADSRILHDQYVFSDQYMALFKGALYHMDVDEIDFLQLGLPINMMNNADKVADQAIGTFEVAGRQITVKDAGVIEQPLGGYRYFEAKGDDGADLEDEVVLFVDPGYFTFDWILVKEGRLVEPRSGSVAGGVSRVLSMLAKTLSEKKLDGREYTNLEAIDKALRKEKRTLRVFGTKYDLNELLSATTPAIDGPINQMCNRVGDMADIDRVILMSGGASVFQRRLKEIVKDFKIEEAAAGIYANVWGYQIEGEKQAVKRGSADKTPKPQSAKLESKEPESEEASQQGDLIEQGYQPEAASEG